MTPLPFGTFSENSSVLEGVGFPNQRHSVMIFIVLIVHRNFYLHYHQQLSNIRSRYEFEANKRNNLIFYGLGGADKETPQQLKTKVCLMEKPAFDRFCMLELNSLVLID